MTPQHDDLEAQQTYVRHLQYAVATTTCRKTVTVLKQMLGEAEARLPKQPAASERV